MDAASSSVAENTDNTTLSVASVTTGPKQPEQPSENLQVQSDIALSNLSSELQHSSLISESVAQESQVEETTASCDIASADGRTPVSEDNVHAATQSQDTDSAEMGTCSSSPKATAATTPAKASPGRSDSVSSALKEGLTTGAGCEGTGTAGQDAVSQQGEAIGQAGSPGKTSVSGSLSAASSPGGVPAGVAATGVDDDTGANGGRGSDSPGAASSPDSHAAGHTGGDVLALVRQAHEGASRPGPYASSSIGVEPGPYGHGHGHGHATGLDDSHDEGEMSGFDPYGYPVYGTSIPLYRGSKGSESGSVAGSPHGHHSRSHNGTPTSSPGKGSPPGMRAQGGKKGKPLPSDDEIISQVLAEAVQESRLAAARAVLQANALSQGSLPLPAALMPAQHTMLTQDAARKVKSKSSKQGGSGDGYGRQATQHGSTGAVYGGSAAYGHEEEERAMLAQSLEIERDILGSDFVPHGRRSSLTGMQHSYSQQHQQLSPSLGSSSGFGYQHRGRQDNNNNSARYGPDEATAQDDALAAAALIPETASVLRPLDAVLRKFSKGLHVLFLGFSQPAKSGRTGHDTFEEQKAAAHVVTKAAWLKTLRFLGLLSIDARGAPALQQLSDLGAGGGHSLPASAMAHTSPVIFSKEEAEGVWGDMIRANRSTIPGLAQDGSSARTGGALGASKKQSPALSAASALIGTAAILGPTQPAGPAHALDEARFIEGLARVAVYALTRHPVLAEIYPGDGDKVYAVFSKCGFGHPAEMARRIREEHTRPVAAAPVTTEGSAYEMRSLVETGMGTGPGRQPVQLQGGLVLEAQREARKAMRIAAVQQAKARQHADAGSHAALASSSSSTETGWTSQQSAALLGTQPSRLTPVGSARQITTYSMNSAGTYQHSYSSSAHASPDPISQAVTGFEASPSGGSSRGGAAYYGGAPGGQGGMQRAPSGIEPSPITAPDGARYGAPASAMQAGMYGASHGHGMAQQGQAAAGQASQSYYGGSPNQGNWQAQGATSPGSLPSSSMYDTNRSYFPANAPGPAPMAFPMPMPGQQYPQQGTQQGQYGTKVQGAYSPSRPAYPVAPDMQGYGSPGAQRVGPPSPSQAGQPAMQGQGQGWVSPVHMPRGPTMPQGGAAAGSPYVRYPTGGSKGAGAASGSPPRGAGLVGQGMGQSSQALGGFQARYPNDSPTGGMTALVSAEEAALQREIDALTAMASDRAEAAGRAMANRRASITGRRASVGQEDIHMGSPHGRGGMRQGKAGGSSVSPGPVARAGAAAGAHPYMYQATGSPTLAGLEYAAASGGQMRGQGPALSMNRVPQRQMQQPIGGMRR